MFNSVFDEFAKNKAIDLFPADISRRAIESLSDFIYDKVNNGVYKAGFATRQRPYEISCRKIVRSAG